MALRCGGQTSWSLVLGRYEGSRQKGDVDGLYFWRGRRFPNGQHATIVNLPASLESRRGLVDSKARSDWV